MKFSLFMACATLALSAGMAQAQTVAAGGPAAAADQSTVQEIVVTAQKRRENLQEVPVAITAISGQALAARGVQNVLGLNNLAPGLRVSTGDASANPKIFIRGVGLSDFDPNASSGIGVYVDGVYIGSPLAEMAGFYDLSQVEVLRGPQGTLYGRNTNGGAINITTNRPTQTYTADASLEYGNYNAVDAEVGIGGPIIQDVLAFRVAGQLVRDDGYTRNLYTGDMVNNTDHRGGRISLLYTPNNKLEVLAHANWFENDGGATQPEHRSLFPTTAAATGANGLCKPGYYNSGQCTDALGYTDASGNPREVDANVQGEDQVRLFGADIQATYHMGGVSLVSITSYQTARRNDMENTDASPLQMLEINYRSRERQFSQELRLQSDGSTRLKWVVGAYFLSEEVADGTLEDVLRALRPLYTTPDDPTGFSFANSVGVFSWPYTQNTESYAIFGQADYNFTDKLIGTVGLRWSADHKTMDYRSEAEYGAVPILSMDAHKTFSAPSWRFGLRYEFDRDLNVYATYNRGYKSGGFFGNLATTPDQLAPYKNETLDAYEVGVKSQLFDNRLRLNVDGFYYSYKNQQVFAQVLRNGVTTTILNNAASSTVYGGEAEATARVIDHLDVSAGLSLLHARFNTYDSEGEDYSGNTLPEAPAVTFNVSATYTYPLPTGDDLIAQADANYSSKVYFDNSNVQRMSQDAVWIADAQVTWRSADRHWETGLFCRNLFDKTYITQISDIASLGVDLLTLDKPRYYGMKVSYHY